MFKESLGKRLKTERERLGFEQKDLAKWLDVSTVSLSGYENDKRPPTGDTLIKMVKLGYDPVFVLTGGRTTDTVINGDELAWLELLRQLSDDDKSRAFVMLSALLNR